MKFSMIGQEICDCLIEVTSWDRFDCNLEASGSKRTKWHPKQDSKNRLKSHSFYQNANYKRKDIHWIINSVHSCIGIFHVPNNLIFWNTFVNLTNIYHNHNPVLSSFMIYPRMCNKSNTTGVTCGAWSAHLPGEPEFIPDFLFSM